MIICWSEVTGASVYILQYSALSIISFFYYYYGTTTRSFKKKKKTRNTKAEEDEMFDIFFLVFFFYYYYFFSVKICRTTTRLWEKHSLAVFFFLWDNCGVFFLFLYIEISFMFYMLYMLCAPGLMLCCINYKECNWGVITVFDLPKRRFFSWNKGKKNLI